MKFCPNCGKETENDAKFCTNCGYNFTKRDNINHSNDNAINQKQITRKAENKNRSHKFVWIIGVMVILCIVSGDWFLFKNKSQSASSANETTTESADAKISSNTNNSSITTQNSNSNDISTHTSDKLSSDIGPKETAAAIAYYADKSGLDGWRDYLKGNNGITIILSSTHTSMVSDKGQGMVYEVLNEQKDSNGVTKNIYTLDEDNTVNIYHLSDENGSDSPATPIESVSKDKIIQYINGHGYASDIKKLGSKVTLDQESN